MKRSVSKGFTLVEILIVVIILGILAAIVIPQFTQASTEARVSNLRTNLQTIRSQLLLYRMQHDNEAYPGPAEADFIAQMTTYTNQAGEAVATPDATHTLGPYLQSIPINPMSGVNTVRVEVGVFAAPAIGADGGWWFNSTTGEFKADLSTDADNHVTADGTQYNAL
jgi:general secretion pathway protein G